MSLEDKVLKIIAENIERELEITPEKNLKLDLAIDSFEMLMITNALEEEFSVHIDETDLESVLTVQDIISRLKNRTGTDHE